MTKTLLGLNPNTVTTFDSFEVGDVNETVYKDIDFKKIRGDKIAYIPQNPMTSLNPSRKIWKHIYDVLIKNKEKYEEEFVGSEAKKNHVSFKTFLKNKIVEILKDFKIQNVEKAIDMYPHELSGGMKQRVIIAMSVLAGAKIIVADEPTTALDPAVQSSVLKLLSEINKDMGITIIFISHDIGVIAKFTDYVYVMYAGKILEKASKYELFSNPIHPYTWALLSSLPDAKSRGNELYKIPGNPPDMENLPQGDAFAPRNEYAVAIDFKETPPLFKVKEGHFAATWTLHPMYPTIKRPQTVIKAMQAFTKNYKK